MKSIITFSHVPNHHNNIIYNLVTTIIIMFNNTTVHTSPNRCIVLSTGPRGRPGTRYRSILLKNIACSVAPALAGGQRTQFLLRSRFPSPSACGCAMVIYAYPCTGSVVTIERGCALMSDLSRSKGIRILKTKRDASVIRLTSESAESYIIYLPIPR